MKCKKSLILFSFALFFISYSINPIVAVEHGISDTLVAGFEYTREVKVMNEPLLAEAFGANWQNIVFFKGVELGMKDKYEIIKTESKELNGKAGWNISYNYWDLTSKEFSATADGQTYKWWPKNPYHLGTVSSWETHICLPSSASSYLEDINFNTNLVPDGFTLTWTIAKDSSYGSSLGLQEDVLFIYRYKGGYDILATFRIRKTDQTILFEYDEEQDNTIPGYDMFLISIICGVEIIALAYLVIKKRSIRVSTK